MCVPFSILQMSLKSFKVLHLYSRHARRDVSSLEMMCLLVLASLLAGTAANQQSRNEVYINLIQLMIDRCGLSQVCDKERFVPAQMDADEPKSCSVCKKCYCDLVCHLTGDCCADVILGLTVLAKDVGPMLDKSRIQCTKWSHDLRFTPNLTDEIYTFNDDRFYFVDSCPTQGTIESSLCQNKDYENFMSILPVMSTKTHISYRNHYCATCNDDTDIVQWGYLLICDDYSKLNRIKDFEDFVPFMHDSKCYVQFGHPEDTRACDYQRRIDCSSMKRPIEHTNDIQILCNMDDYFDSSELCDLCSISKTTTAIIPQCTTKNSTTKQMLLDNMCTKALIIGPVTVLGTPVSHYCIWCNWMNSPHYICQGEDIFEEFGSLFDITKIIPSKKSFDNFCADGLFYDSYKVSELLVCGKSLHQAFNTTN